MTKLNKTIVLAAKYHNNQKDKNDELYILHPL